MSPRPLFPALSFTHLVGVLGPQVREERGGIFLLPPLPAKVPDHIVTRQRLRAAESRTGGLLCAYALRAPSKAGVPAPPSLVVWGLGSWNSSLRGPTNLGKGVHSSSPGVGQDCLVSHLVIQSYHLKQHGQGSRF